MEKTEVLGAARNSTAARFRRQRRRVHLACYTIQHGAPWAVGNPQSFKRKGWNGCNPIP